MYAECQLQEEVQVELEVHELIDEGRPPTGGPPAMSNMACCHLLSSFKMPLEVKLEEEDVEVVVVVVVACSCTPVMLCHPDDFLMVHTQTTTS